MVCHECGRAVQRGDRFCNHCGTSLQGVTDTFELLAVTGEGAPGLDLDRSDQPAGAAPAAGREPAVVDARTELLAVVDDPVEAAWGEDDPVWAATGSQPSVATSQLPATEPITEVRMATVQDTVAPDVAATTALDVNAPTTAQMPVAVGTTRRTGFRFGAVTLLGIAGGLLTLVSLFTTVLSITSDTRITPSGDVPVGFRLGTWIVDDLADNLSIAGLVASLVMVGGGVAAGFHWRWGAGLAAGGGLAFAGVAAIAIGLAQVPIDATREFAAIPSEQQFTITITKDVGYWLLVAAAALGVVLFFAALNEAFGDWRSGLNPWIAALGALAALVAAGGPLLPENLAAWGDNVYLVEGPGEPPAMLLVGRLVQLGLLALTGVIGFLSVRRWGLGVAVGGLLPALWMAVSTLFELTDRPVGPGYRNPGASEMHLHGVTIIGMSALAAMAVLAIVAAYDQGVREHA